MLNASLYVVATSLVLLAGQALAAELIELNDANKNLLHLEVSKALEVVQAALTNEFKFNRVEDAQNFVLKCNYLEQSMMDESDDQFQGLAGKIKALLNDEQLKSRCHINAGKFALYSFLNDKEDGSFYLSNKRFTQLVALGEKLEKDSEMKQVLGHLYETKTKNTGRQLLSHAAEDTSIYFGELDNSRWLTTRYHSGCSISLIKPICKLVRGVSAESVSAFGSDLAEFHGAITSNDQSTIDKRTQASGITLDDLKSQCKVLEKSMHPINQVNNYLKAGFLSESEIVEQSKSDPEFNFYYELKRLCEA